MRYFPRIFLFLLFVFALVLPGIPCLAQTVAEPTPESLQQGRPVYVQRYWIEFCDKGPLTAERLSGSEPLLLSEGWTRRALERRRRLGIKPDEKDLPLFREYLQQLSQVEGLRIRCTSRWLNAVSVDATSPTALADAGLLPFVQNIQPVRRYRALPEPVLELPDSQEQSALLFTISNDLLTPGISAGSFRHQGQKVSDFNRSTVESTEVLPGLDYGFADFQVTMLHTDYLHRMGYRGEGLLIGVLDAGWSGADSLPQFQRLRERNGIVDVWNFFLDNDSVFNYSSHGTAVLSTMGGYLPGQFQGTAPDAEFALYLTEVEQFERIVEEDFWLAGAERAEMQGVDIINTSLGYTEFDDSDSLFDHTYADMDGNTTVVSRAADWAASRGILVVVSAGNQGSSTWQYISAPADADSVLAVGAVDALGQYASFSSRGPSADGDVKPNVAAVGQGTAVVASSGTVVFGNGTSFSAPLISGSSACLWQAFPEKSNMEILRAIEASANQFSRPDDLLGYGIPDFGGAFHLLAPPAPETLMEQIGLFPNPVSNGASAYFGPQWSEGSGDLEIFHADGRKVLFYSFFLSAATIRVVELEGLSGLSTGVYVLRFRQGEKTGQVKFYKN